MMESAIQSKIIKALSAAGWFVVKLIQTNTPGIPDLMALNSGRTVFIEVKRPGQKPSALQGHRIETLQKNGFEALVAFGIDEVKHLLTAS